MAQITLQVAQTFPVGTSVSAYNATDWNPAIAPSGTPPGVAVSTATVAANGTVTFTGLTSGARYFAYASVSSQNRYVQFTAGTGGTPQDVASGAIPVVDVGYGDSQAALLASAARTTAQTVAAPTNYTARGVAIFLNVTAASGTGGLTVRIDALDPVSGAALALNTAPTTVIATGLTIYTVYPGVGAGATQATSGVLPRTWQVRVTVGDASSYTYSLAYALLV